MPSKMLQGVMALLLVAGISVVSIYTYEEFNSDDVIEEANIIFNQDMVDTIESIPNTELSSAEIDGLLFMREEEKLAYDVYVTLYEVWGTKIFNNIAKSEMTHMGAVATLLADYSIEDPIAELEVGEYITPLLQTYYDDLVDLGSNSLVAAFTVGAIIEEIDIVDLYEYINGTTNEDSLFVYGILIDGSFKHLNSFVSQLSKNFVDYNPQYMTQTEFDLIMNK